MISLNGDKIIETTETIKDIKVLRARRKEINERIDALKLEPDMIMVHNMDKDCEMASLIDEKERITSVLKSVNLT